MTRDDIDDWGQNSDDSIKLAIKLVIVLYLITIFGLVVYFKW